MRVLPLKSSKSDVSDIRSKLYGLDEGGAGARPQHVSAIGPRQRTGDQRDEVTSRNMPAHASLSESYNPLDCSLELIQSKLRNLLNRLEAKKQVCIYWPCMPIESESDSFCRTWITCRKPLVPS